MKINYLPYLCLLSLILGCSEPEKSTEDLIQETIAQMTLEEKVDLVHANSKFTIPGVPRLGIPELTMSDGPHSIRYEISRDNWDPAGWTTDSSTYLPCGIMLASTWNRELAAKSGKVLGEEARYRDKDVHLAPSMNLIRRPLCGRNFEYFSEDPYLTAEFGIPYVNAVQENSVISCIKHYIAYNYKSHQVDVMMNERTLREVYNYAFERAIDEADVLAIMGAYNKFRGEYCGHNDYLLNTLLKDKMAYRGLVMSDWAGVHSTEEALYNGLDIEMGTELGEGYDNYYMANPLLKYMQENNVSDTILDDKVRRILRVYHKTRLEADRPTGSFNTKIHQDVAREVAEQGIVLLKNEGETLPLNSAELKTLAVIGDNATALHNAGGGSSETKALYEISPLQGIKNLLGDQVKVLHARGYAPEEEGVDPAKLVKEAIAVAKRADAVVFFGGLNHDFDTEIKDKESLLLPYEQDALIKKLLAVNPDMVVYLITGSPITPDEMWLDKNKALLMSGYAGMEGGNAVASVLFGEVNPSGKLSFSFPRKLSDSPALYYNSLDSSSMKDYYRETVFLGYKHYDKNNIEVVFPFGYGLSYTAFDYTGLTLSDSAFSVEDKSINVTVSVENTGDRDGMEVVQVYLQKMESQVERPLKELKAFDKKAIASGALENFTMKINLQDLAYFDQSQDQFVIEPGIYKVHVGSSSRDILLTETFSIY